MHKTFIKGSKIQPKELTRWIVETMELREFFSFIELGSAKVTLK